MQDSSIQPNRLKPEMPRIPGVNNPVAGNPSVNHDATSSNPTAKVWKPANSLIFLAVLVLAALSGVVWWALHASRASDHSPQIADSGDPFPEGAAALSTHQTSPDLPTGPGEVATIDELAKPWSAKKFLFVNPETHESVSAMVVRLPGASEDRSDAYWAFSLTTPYGQCDLDYITDLSQLAARYGYRATHPMVVSSCDGTIYDPLRVDAVSTGAWVRGEVVKGGGIRPPLAIEIRVQRRAIIAARME